MGGAAIYQRRAQKGEVTLATALAGTDVKSKLHDSRLEYAPEILKVFAEPFEVILPVILVAKIHTPPTVSATHADTFLAVPGQLVS